MKSSARLVSLTILFTSQVKVELVAAGEAGKAPITICMAGK